MIEEINQPQPPASKTSLTIPFLVILSILSLAISGYLFWQNQQLMKQLAVAQKLTKTSTAVLPSPLTSPTTDPTAGWKTYTNSEIGFKFQYPSEWKIQTGIPNSGLISLTFNNNSRFFVWYNPSYTIAEWLEETQSGKITGKKKIGDYTFTVIKGGLFLESLEYALDVKGNGFIRFVIEPVTDIPQAEKTFNLILSTFKFTQ